MPGTNSTGLQVVKYGTTDEFGTEFDFPADPIPNQITVDYSGGSLYSNIVHAELRASLPKIYTNIQLQVISQEAGRVYEASLDGVDYDLLSTGISFPDMDSTGGELRQDVYFRISVDNDGTVTPGIYDTPKIRLTFNATDL